MKGPIEDMGKSKNSRNDVPLSNREIMAERRYVDDRTNPPEVVLVRLGKPRKTEVDGKYECAMEIRDNGAICVRRLVGVDAFEALQLALIVLETELSHVNSRLVLRGSRLVWGDEKRSDFVLPVYLPWPSAGQEADGHAGQSFEQTRKLGNVKDRGRT